MCAVGELLGKDLSEIREMPTSELFVWLAWIKMKHEAENKAVKNARGQHKPQVKPTMGRRR